MFGVRSSAIAVCATVVAACFALAARASDLDIEKSTVTLSPTTILSGGLQTAYLTVQARNSAGSVMPNVPVDLESSLTGMHIKHHSTSTNIMGLATFSITAYVAGVALLSPKIDNQIVKPQFLTVINPTGGAPPPPTAPPTYAEPSDIYVVSASTSQASVSGSPANPDGASTIAVSVTLRNSNGQSLAGKAVTARSAMSGLAISPEYATTDSNGSAMFFLRSVKPGDGFLTVVSEGVALDAKPAFKFALPGAPLPGATSTAAIPVPSVAPGSLIKLPDDRNPKTQEDSTVYYVGNDGKRHMFPNGKIFFSWYSSYASVKTMSAWDMAKIALGANVTYRPGSRLIKIASSPKVYAVSRPRALRWVKDASLASALYGADWKKSVEDLPEGFFADYRAGSDISSAGDYDKTAELQSSTTVDHAL